MNWLPLIDSSQLEVLDADSNKNELTAVAIFKHSTRCSISLAAKNRMETSWDFTESQFPIYYLDLLNHRDISNKIAEKYNVEHESPQLLIIKNGKCVYSATHTGIRPSEVKQFFSV